MVRLILMSRTTQEAVWRKAEKKGTSRVEYSEVVADYIEQESTMNGQQANEVLTAASAPTPLV